MKGAFGLGVRERKSRRERMRDGVRRRRRDEGREEETQLWHGAQL